MTMTQHIGIVLFDLGNAPGDHRIFNPVICIDKTQIVPICTGNSIVSRRSHSTVLLMNHLYPFVHFGILIADLPGSVR